VQPAQWTLNAETLLRMTPTFQRSFEWDGG
jgi:hypothetical protein